MRRGGGLIRSNSEVTEIVRLLQRRSPMSPYIGSTGMVVFKETCLLRCMPSGYSHVPVLFLCSSQTQFIFNSEQRHSIHTHTPSQPDHNPHQAHLLQSPYSVTSIRHHSSLFVLVASLPLHTHWSSLRPCSAFMPRGRHRTTTETINRSSTRKLRSVECSVVCPLLPPISPTANHTSLSRPMAPLSTQTALISAITVQRLAGISAC